LTLLWVFLEKKEEKEKLQQEWKEKINRSIHGTTITSKTHHWQIKNQENENSTLYI
jgi:hypothetical protein